VDTSRFGPTHRSEALRQAWGVAPGGRVVLYVGRLAPEKNLEALLQAFAAMRGVEPGLRLVFVGDGPMRRELEQRCPDAVFAGLRSGTDLAAHYASGDMFVFPSMTETFGNVTPEAMASGLPVLAYEHAAAAQLIRSGHSGLLAPCGDQAAFVRQAVALAADPVAARGLGLVARDTALGLGWERIVARIESVFVGATLQRHGAMPQSPLATDELHGHAALPPTS
jgi:glycosyltransferase involved in cell wall biosynthesis